MRILITGANGFIGSALAARLLASGHTPIGAVRRTSPGARIEERPYDLSWTRVPPNLFDGIDVLVHTAFVRTSSRGDGFAMNVDGSLRLLEAARAANVPQCIFLSSFSAWPDARSEYGRQKFVLEGTFSAPGDAVVRPGLVVGNGGLFNTLRQTLLRAPLIPLVGGGTYPVQTVFIDDLVDAIERIIVEKLSGTFNVAEERSHTYAALCREITTQAGLRARFVYLPVWLTFATLTIAKPLGIALPMNLDNLLGLLASRPRETGSDLARLSITVRSMRESISSLDRPVRA